MIVSDIDIKIKRSKRKTLSIYIERNGSVTALVPQKLSDEEVHDLIKSKEYQIYKYLAEWTQLNDSKVEREYVSGQSFLYLGRNYRLKLVDDDISGNLKLKNGYFILPRKDKEKAKNLFIEFYKIKLREKITPLLETFTTQLDLDYHHIKIMDLQNRWASCSNNKNLNFHWKCAMAPLDVLSYIVVHELVHLIHMNHTKDFWNEIDKIMPHYQQHIEWLKVNGAGLDL